jgi:hypothetical protein
MLNERPNCQLTYMTRNMHDIQFFEQGRMSISKPDGRNIGLVNIIPSRAWHVPMMTQPMFLDLHLPSTLYHRVSRQLTHIRRGEFVNLGSARVFLEKMGCGKMEL